MNRILRWLAIAAGTLVVLLAAVVLYVFAASERVVARTYDVPLRPFEAPSDPASIARGERLSTLYGCNNCHGPKMEGTIFDEPSLLRIAAPNLTRIVKEYSDAELERLLRHGIKRDGTSSWIMPAAMFNHLTDGDLAAIIAYVRSVPDRDGLDREHTFRPLARIGIATDRFKPSAEDIDVTVPRAVPDYSDPISHGRYLVMTACTECHGPRLQGHPYLRAPNLVAAAAYSEQDFAKLLRTGVGLNGRDLGLMSKISKVRFASLSDEEVRAMRAYLSLYVQQGGTYPP